MNMIDAIIPKAKETIAPVNHIDDARFAYLINEVFSVMLDYSRIRSQSLNKKSPLQIGNVSFWFAPDAKTKEPMLSFDISVKGWDESAIVQDLEQHFYDLHFNPVKR